MTSRDEIQLHMAQLRNYRLKNQDKVRGSPRECSSGPHLQNEKKILKALRYQSILQTYPVALRPFYLKVMELSTILQVGPQKLLFLDVIHIATGFAIRQRNSSTKLKRPLFERKKKNSSSILLVTEHFTSTTPILTCIMFIPIPIYIYIYFAGVQLYYVQETMSWARAALWTAVPSTSSTSDIHSINQMVLRINFDLFLDGKYNGYILRCRFPISTVDRHASLHGKIYT